MTIAVETRSMSDDKGTPCTAYIGNSGCTVRPYKASIYRIGHWQVLREQITSTG